MEDYPLLGFVRRTRIMHRIANRETSPYECNTSILVNLIRALLCNGLYSLFTLSQKDLVGL